jgi:membrane protein implicated in regulation of membrane protease activity
MDFYVYIICLGVGLIFTLVSAVFGHMLGGHDGDVGGSGGHAEAGFDTHGMPGVSAFSPTIIAIFVTAFGGLGIVFHEIPATNVVWLSAPLAVVGAFLIASLMLWFLRQLFRQTQGSSESRVAEIVGMVAHVISPIPENGVGEVAYVQSGSRYTAPAREESGLKIDNGRAVKVIRIIGSQFYVIGI